VNPYKIGAFKGEVTLNPAGDNWKQTDRRPDLQVADDNGFDAIQYLAEELGVTGTDWEEWQNNWTGRSVSTERSQTGNPNQRRQTVRGYETTTVTQTGTNSREGIQTSLTSTVNAMDYGDRVVDISYLPYMRSRPVMYVVKNLKANSRFYGFFDDTRIDADYIRPADVFKVTKQSGATTPVWDPALINNEILADNVARAFGGEIQPAFSVGDIVKNVAHAGTIVNAISNITDPLGALSFNLTVNSATNVAVGHHVFLYNHAPERAEPSVRTLGPNVPASFRTTITDTGKNTSAELNRKSFVVSAVSGTTLTLKAIDGSIIPAFSAYDTTAYPSGEGSRLQRLQASAVVAFEGVKEGVDTTYIHVVNVKNGFAVGENLSGDANIGNGAKNQVVLNEVNGNSVGTVVSTMKKVGDAIRTDLWGSTVGVFNIPADTFRTGERSLKFIDNISNSDADFDSKGTAIYAAVGMTLAKERTVVNSRDINFVEDRLFEELPIRRTTTSTRLLYSYYTGHDPVAQTFVVSSEGGAMISSVDMYFSEAGSRPITVEIRACNNGVPTSKILPFTAVTLNPEQIAVSDDGSLATNFKFEAPVYLLDNETYALVVKTDQPGCQVFVSELGKNDLITENIITSQPLTGSLYLSQNSREFEINPLLDMKFTMYRCEFDTSVRSTIELKATPPLQTNLRKDAFEFATGTNLVRVYHRNHGFSSGDLAVISGVVPGFYGANSTTLGAPATVLNGNHIVLGTGITTNSFIIELQTTDSSGNSLLSGTNADFIKGFYGGSNVVASRQLYSDYAFIKSNDLNFQDTTLSWYMDSEDYTGSRTGYQPVIVNETYEFENRQVVKNFENQKILTSVPLIKSPSLKIRATMTSANKAVSPVIDLQKMSVYAIQNLVDSRTSEQVNVPALDKRTLLDSTTVTAGDAHTAGTGTITATTGSSTVTGTTSKFLTETKVGDTLRTAAGVALGVVSAVATNTSLTLSAVSLVAATAATFEVVSPGNIEITNANSKGTLKVWIDAADNALANATIGSQIVLDNLGFLSGTYNIENLVEYRDTSRFGGSADGNAVELTLTTLLPVLNSNTVYLNLIQDWIEFEMSGSFAISSSSDVLGATADLTSEVDAGDIIVAFNNYVATTPFGLKEYMVRTTLGTVDTVTAGDVTLLANAAITPTTTNRAYVRKSVAGWSIAQLDSWIDDYAPIGATNAANYVTRPLVLQTPADSIRFLFEANIPQFAGIDIYYKAYTEGDDPTKLRWTKADFTVTTKDAIDVFKEREVNVLDVNEYTTLTMKFVLKSSNTTYVPKIRNLRMIAHS
jgi:hypothetical protein